MEDSNAPNARPTQNLQPNQAENIVKTPQIPVPDSALRYHQSRDDGSYFSLQVGNELAISTSPVHSGSLGIPRVELKQVLKKESRKKAVAAAAPVPEEDSSETEPESPSDEEKLVLEIRTPKVEPIPQIKRMPIHSMPTPPLSRSMSALSFTSNHSAMSTASQSDKETWDRTIARVINGIVSIKATTTRPFDTESAGDYTATGFVISKKHGLILSNRHVVSPAPITSVAVFVNYEEIPCYPVYRDPIHDFGVFRYDPAKLKHINVEEIELRPDLARVGEDIKVVGNDAGEKLSILGSTLARLDRHAPSYGVDSYNDFNTFYMQAASGTSGGSSGSPVLNIHGQAIALNAGGSNSSQSSFYLPLDRVVRAVEKIKRGEVVSRGTLQTEFLHNSYDELRRLGLQEEVEEECRVRNTSATGLLSVARVLKGGPASGERSVETKEPAEVIPEGVTRVAGLEPGDILFTCNGQYITDFIGLWTIIDDSVGENIVLDIFRSGKEGKSGPRGKLQVVCTVQDLHSITPNRFLEIGGAVIHDLSYQVGRSHNVQLGTGVFCAGLFPSLISCGFSIANLWQPLDFFCGLHGAVISSSPMLPESRQRPLISLSKFSRASPITNVSHS